MTTPANNPDAPDTDEDDDAAEPGMGSTSYTDPAEWRLERILGRRSCAAPAATVRMEIADDGTVAHSSRPRVAYYQCCWLHRDTVTWETRADLVEWGYGPQVEAIDQSKGPQAREAPVASVRRGGVWLTACTPAG